MPDQSDRIAERERWVVLIRRSFAIPDIVVGDVAIDRIAALGASKGAVDDVIDAGANESGKGHRELHGLLAGDSLGLALVARAIADTRAGADTEVGIIVEHVRSFVHAHPFQAGCGCYFT